MTPPPHRSTRRALHRAATARRWGCLYPYLVPLAVLFAVTIPHFGQGDFRTDTGWYAAIGLSSVRNWAHAASLADFFTLHAEPGKPFFNKPPLPLWIHGIVLHLLGTSLAAARLPTIAAAAACVALTVNIVRSASTGLGAVPVGITPRTQAMAAGVVLALTLEFFRRTREISLDMWQLAFMLGAVAITVTGCRSSARLTARHGALAGAFIGLALLCKPLVALLATVILVAWLLHSRRLRFSWMLAHAVAIITVALPWYIMMTVAHGDAFLDRHFIGEVADRASGAMTAGPAGQSTGGAAPIWFYALQILQTYWPWLITMVLAIVALARNEFSSRQRSVALLAFFWLAAWFALITVFPDRRPRYALVLWPAGAILSGLWIGLPAARVARPLLRRTARWGLAVAVAAGVIFMALPVRVQRPPNPQWPALFEWMATNGVTDLWQGSCSGPTGSRLYLRTGRWPIQTQDRAREIITTPPSGSLLLYHRRDGYTPGAGEVPLFRSGDLTVTLLQAKNWNPIPTVDPGEND